MDSTYNPSKLSYISKYKPKHRRTKISKGLMNNFNKASFSVHTTNRFKNNSNTSKLSWAQRPSEGRFKINKDLKEKFAQRNRARIRTWKSLEGSKFSNWSSFTKGKFCLLYLMKYYKIEKLLQGFIKKANNLLSSQRSENSNSWTKGEEYYYNFLK